MHTLALVNQKGGCGKTTTAVNLAGALAARGGRVLLVDVDPQAHATLALGCAILDEPSLAELLIDHVPADGVIQSAPGGFDLVPATPAVAEFEEVAARRLEPERTLARALAEVAGNYDYCIIDCPPRTDGVLARNALRAADTALLVVESGAFALQGAHQAVEILEEIAQDMDRALELRVVGTLFDRRTRFARELLIAMQARFGELLFDTVVHTSVRLREAAAAGVPVQVLDPASRATRNFQFLADEVRAHVREHDLDREHERAAPILASSPPRPVLTAPRAAP